MKFFEPYFEERVKAAKARAQRVHDGVFHEDDGEDTVLAILRWIICQHHDMPFFDPYFDDRTFDDMVFEVELIRLSKHTGVDRGSETLKEAPKADLDALTDDWITADQATMDAQFQEDAKKFMQSGEFKGENK